MDNRELLKFLLETIRKYPNDQELGKNIRTSTQRFLGEFKEENRNIDRLTDEEISLLSSLNNIR